MSRVTAELKERALGVDLHALAGASLKKAGTREWSGPCPSCGGKDRFSLRLMDDARWLWVCRGCSDGRYQDAIAFARHFHNMDFTGAVEWLTGEQVQQQIVPRAGKLAPAPQKRPSWMKYTHEEYNGAYTADFGRVRAAWGAYKNLPDRVLGVYELGLGILPHSHCKHERLIVPVWAGDELRNLRGRQISCDCDGKWVASGGWSLPELPLYNQTAIHEKALVILVENPVDAILVGLNQEAVFKLMMPHVIPRTLVNVTEVVGVACYSVSYWQDAWTEQVGRGLQTIVALDNDLAGNGGAWKRAELVAQREAEDKPVTQAGGVRIVNTLLESGVSAALLDWRKAPAKMDIGGFLSNE